LTKIISAFALLVVYINFAYATIIFVPEEYESIGRAIAKCSEGDTVLVARGKYDETFLHLGDKSLTLASTYIFTKDINDIYETELRGDHARPVISIYGGGQKNINIIGFTLSGGSAPYGGGMDIFDSNPTLSHLIIVGNACGKGGGAGICARNSSPIIENCLIAGNASGDVAGGYYGKQGSNAILRNVIFAGNEGSTLGGAVYLRDRSQTLFENVLFLNNGALHGTALALKYDNQAILDRCLLVEKEYSNFSIVYSGLRSTTTLIRSTLRNTRHTNPNGTVRIENLESGLTHLYNSLRPGVGKGEEGRLYSYDRVSAYDKIDFVVSRTDKLGLPGYPEDSDSNPLLQSFGFESFERLNTWAGEHLGFSRKIRQNNIDGNRMLRAGQDHTIVMRSLEKLTPTDKNPLGNSEVKYSSQFTDLDRRRIANVSVDANDGKNFDALLEGYLEVGNLEAISLMLEKNPKLDRYIRLSGKREYKTPLELAIGSKNLPLINLLLEKGASPGKGLGGAAVLSDTTILAMLLRNSENVNECMGFDPENYDCYTALSSAAEAGNLGVVKYLLSKGAEPNYGIMEACENQHYEIARLLFEEGAPANISRDEQVSLFGRMIMKNDHEAVKLLMEYGAVVVPEYRNKFDVYPVEQAEQQGDSTMIELLKAHIKNRPLTAKDSLTLINDAVESGDHKWIREVAAWTDFTLIPLHIEGPLVRAIDNVDTLAMQILLEAGASLNASAYFEQNATNAAVVKRNPAVFRCLLEHSPALNATDNSILTPTIWLTYAILAGDDNLAISLLDSGAQPVFSTVNMEDPIQLAIEQENLLVTAALLKAGALEMNNQFTEMNILEAYKRDLV